MRNSVAAAAAALAGLMALASVALAQSPPRFEVDPYWPRPLPDNQILGQVSGVATDARDNV